MSEENLKRDEENLERFKLFLEKKCTYFNCGKNCYECGGRGTVPTEVGKYLLGFIGHHLEHRVGSSYGHPETLFEGELSDPLCSSVRELLDRGLH